MMPFEKKKNTSRSPDSNRNRILVVSDAAPHRNGVGAYYADLIEELESHVDQAEIVCPEIVGEKWFGGWSIPLPGDKTQKLCIPNAFELQKKIRSVQPSVVVIPTPGMFGLVGAVVASRMGIPVIVGFHTWFEKLASLYWNRVQGGLTKTYFELVNKALFRLADRVLANSEEMVEIARELGAPNVGLMGTPISQTLLTAPLGPIPKKVKNILFVGRLAAEKNVESLVQSARDLPHLHFRIAGDGPERESIEALAKDVPNVEMLGWVSRENLIALIDENDALVLPSKVESFGTVAMEAMARQRVVLTSKACGIADWDDLAEGLYVVDDNQSLTAELDRISKLSEFELYGRCNLARKAVLTHIEWNRNLWLRCVSEGDADLAENDVDNLILKITKAVWK